MPRVLRGGAGGARLTRLRVLARGLLDGARGGFVRLAPMNFSRRTYLRGYRWGRWLRELAVPPRGRRMK